MVTLSKDTNNCTAEQSKHEYDILETFISFINLSPLVCCMIPFLLSHDWHFVTPKSIIHVPFLLDMYVYSTFISTTYVHQHFLNLKTRLLIKLFFILLNSCFTWSNEVTILRLAFDILNPFPHK